MEERSCSEAREANRFKNLTRKASSVVGLEMDGLEPVAERRLKGQIGAFQDKFTFCKMNCANWEVYSASDSSQ